MGTLTSSLNILTSALADDQTALATVSNNVANAQTPGYTRKVADFGESDPVRIGSLQLGQGSSIVQIQSLRDRVLDQRIAQQTQGQAASQSALSALQNVQSLFPAASGGLGSALDGFFSSLSQLQASPSDMGVRQSVLASAQALAGQFHSLSASMSGEVQSLNGQVTDAAAQVNQLTSRIAALGVQIAGVQGAGQDAGTLEDERTAAVQTLSGLIDVSAVQTENGGLTLTTAQGVPLVVGSESVPLTAAAGAGGSVSLVSQGVDVTSRIEGGQLGGVLAVRDGALPGYRASLDALAQDLATQVNAVQTAGTDLNGNPGGAFFSISAGTAGAAASIAVALADPSQIAAGQDGTPGDNRNAQALAQLGSSTIVGGRTPTDAYGALAAQVGEDVSQAQAQSDAQGLVLQQLNNQRGALSGVSLDAEAESLTQYQRAYQAAAQIISVVNQLMADAMNMASGQGMSV